MLGSGGTKETEEVREGRGSTFAITVIIGLSAADTYQPSYRASVGIGGKAIKPKEPAGSQVRQSQSLQLVLV